MTAEQDRAKVIDILAWVQCFSSLVAVHASIQAAGGPGVDCLLQLDCAGPASTTKVLAG